MHPLTAEELGDRFELAHSVRFGQLPTVYVAGDPGPYLKAYVGTYLREEVQAEALTHSLDGFTRFMVAASFSQASVLNVSAVSRELGVARKTVDAYFELLDDLLLATRLPVFSRRARRDLATHPKFYYFDAGVFRALRPQGPLDSDAEIGGAALETLVLQELRAHNENRALGYELSHWRTRTQLEVDFVLYGPRGLRAFEVKLSPVLREAELAPLRAFREDYPSARCFLLYGGTQRYDFGGIEVLPVAEALKGLGGLLA